eukprot:gene3690-4037_t
MKAPSGRSRSSWTCPCGLSPTQVLLLSFLLLQVVFFYYLMCHHKFFRQSVYDLSGLVDSSLKQVDLEGFDLDRRKPPPVHTSDYSTSFPVEVLGVRPAHLQAKPQAKHALVDLLGTFIEVDFPDLKYRPDEEVRRRLKTVFQQLPADGFLSQYKNPCWDSADHGLVCLPYAYILGQPKSGTSDLFSRMVSHDLVIPPFRKEVRWFTRGEFNQGSMSHEEEEDGSTSLQSATKRLLGPSSSIYSFTMAFRRLAHILTHSEAEKAQKLITIDGGPHTLWWPTQGPDGAYLPPDIPPPQILRLMQPQARFLVTLSDPVHRFYSDYYFLGDDLRPVADSSDEKSSQQLHGRTVSQVKAFTACVDHYVEVLRRKAAPFLNGSLSASIAEENIASLPAQYRGQFPYWVRASQMCAGDRIQFARGGWGRIAIGLYSLHLLRWVEHFDPEQFLILRLEDFESDPLAYMSRVFGFLQLDEPADWQKILRERHANSNTRYREPMLPETEASLKKFYQPYNELLVVMMRKLFHGQDGSDPRRFLWQGIARNQSTASEGSKPQAPATYENEQDHLLENGDDGRGQGHLENASKARNQQGRLRGAGSGSVVVPITLRPRAFDIKGLEGADSDELSTVLPSEPAHKYAADPAMASQALCAAAFALDIPQLKYLLYTVGLPSDLIYAPESHRNAMHCLSLVYTMAEAHSRSQIFSELKGVPTYLNKHFKPPLEDQLSSVSARVLLDRLEQDIVTTAQWLIRAGVPVALQDSGGNTPLHLAAYGGLTALTALLVDVYRNQSLSLDTLDTNYRRTALHYAASQGHAKICKILLAAGSDPLLTDAFRVSPKDIIANPGPVSAEEAADMGIPQRPARQIPRVVHPELHSNDSRLGWVHGSGGWNSHRLSGFEEDFACPIVDQYHADEISSEEIFRNYLAHNAPILIKGLLDDWPAAVHYQKEQLLAEKGFLPVQVSDIPYAKKFGGEKAQDMTLRQYVEAMDADDVPGWPYPWYVFRGHRIPSMSDDDPLSLVPYDICPTPALLQRAFDMGKGYSWGALPLSSQGGGNVTTSLKAERKIFVNAQWALGAEGTGAPVHFHNTAWNAVVYGAKRWIIHPPHEAIMSHEQIRSFAENSAFMKTARICTQLAGEVMIIPENFGHGVLNLQQTIAVATEYKHSLFRVKPSTRLFTLLPSFDNQRGSLARGLATGGKRRKGV